MNRQSDRKTDRQTNRQTDRQRDRQTERQTSRQADQIDINTHTQLRTGYNDCGMVLFSVLSGLNRATEL